jgi:replication initiation and membrane attachment protein DnaB
MIFAEVYSFVWNCSSRAVINNIDELDEIDYDEMEKQLEKLIMEEMLNTRPNKNKKSKPIPIQKQKKQQVFEEDEDFEDEGDLEFNENDY